MWRLLVRIPLTILVFPVLVIFSLAVGLLYLGQKAIHEDKSVDGEVAMTLVWLSWSWWASIWVKR